MKNILKVIFAISIMLVILTGCSVRTHVIMDIKANKTLSVEYITAMDDEAIDSSIYYASQSGDLTALTAQPKYTDEERWAYVEESISSGDQYNGYDRRRYEQDGYKGSAFGKELDGTIDDYVGDGKNVDFSILSESGKMFTKNGNKYILKIQLYSGDQASEAEQYEQAGVNMDYKFIVKLPKPADFSNASEISDDKLTYSWNLLKDKEVDLEFTLVDPANQVDWFSILIYASFILIIVLIFALTLSSRKDKGNSVTINQNEDNIIDENISNEEDKKVDEEIIK